MDDLEARVDERARSFMSACEERGLLVSSDGRVSEASAAGLLGCSRGHLKRLRLGDEGPPVFHVPLAGCKYSYGIRELATWVELGRRR